MDSPWGRGGSTSAYPDCDLVGHEEFFLLSIVLRFTEMAGGGAVGLLQALLSTDNDIRSKAEVGANQSVKHPINAKNAILNSVICRRVMRLCLWNRG